VTALQLDVKNPQLVMATIAVDALTPIRSDTKAGLDFQGLTGVPVITLQGGSTPLPATQKSEPYVLVADPLAGQSMTNAARDALRRLDGILMDNAEPVRSMIANLNTFSSALARNSERLDVIVGGLEKMMGGKGSAVPVIYDLTAPTQFTAIAKPRQTQLTVAEPTALIMFETRKFLVRPNPSDDPTFANAEWSDNIPKLLQAKIVQAFENVGLSQSVSRPTEGLTADKQLAIDIRKFHISVSPEPMAEIEFVAKILSDGRVAEAKVFRASVPVSDMKAPLAAAALDMAFSECAIALVEWAADVI